MKLIKLTQGQYTLVDDKVYAKLSRYKWRAQWDKHTQSFYAVRNIRLPNGKWTTERMHRRILCLKHGDKRQGDHINHDTLDNRRFNIRIVTASENRQNNRGKGYYKAGRKFRVKIKVDNVEIYLGMFNTPSEARAAYLAAKRIYHPSAPILG